MKKNISLSFFFIISILLNGCTKKLEITESPIDFQFVTVQLGDSFESLARKHAGSEDMAWRIKEFNNTRSLAVGEQIIIPRTPFRPGGLTAQGYQLMPVLSYHNFSKGRSNNKLEVSAKLFRSQLQYLKRNNYHVITMEQLLEFIEFGQVPEKSIVITIDDGWKATYDIAYPILKEFGYSATLFIPTEFIDSGHKLAMTWDQLRQMVSDNTIDIQCHTKSHRDLSTLAKNETFESYIKAVEQDIQGSKQRIYNQLGKEVSSLAYPFGKTNPLVIAIVKKHGYKTAFTVKRKSNPFYKQNFLLTRAMVFGTHSLSAFAKYLKYFERSRIAEIEPIDTLQSLASIALNVPDKYENKKQWRTALLARKLQRDKLISQKQKSLLTKQGTIEELRLLTQSIEQSKLEIIKLESKLNLIAEKYYNKAIDSKSARTAQKYLLKSLLFNPTSSAPLELFQSDMGKAKFITYKVKENDSLKSIARKIYKDSKKSILITVFNENVIDSSSLVKGMELTLPLFPTGTEVKAHDVSRCGVTSSKSTKKLADNYYIQANDNFHHDQIAKAINHLKKVICLNPKHTDAKEMLEMLKDL